MMWITASITLLFTTSLATFWETDWLVDTDDALVNYEEACVFAEAGDFLLFSSCSHYAEGDTFLRLFFNGEEVSENDDACCYSSVIEWVAEEQGEYCLHMGCYADEECKMEVTFGYYAVDPYDCTYTSSTDIGIIVVYCSFLPLMILFLMIGISGALSKGAYGCNGQTCCCCCCGTASSWARTNRTFAILDLLMIIISSIVLMALGVDWAMYLGLPFMLLMAWAHRRAGMSLLAHRHVRLPSVDNIGGPVEVEHQQQQQPRMSLPPAVPHYSQPPPVAAQTGVQYCSSCGGPFMLPSPLPFQVKCPHCHCLLTMQNPSLAPSIPVGQPLQQPMQYPQGPSQPMHYPPQVQQQPQMQQPPQMQQQPQMQQPAQPPPVSHHDEPVLAIEPLSPPPEDQSDQKD